MEDPSFTVNYGDGVLEARPNNSALYVYLGDLVSRSHIFIETGKSDTGSQVGIFVFRATYPEAFGRIATYMINSGYESHLNLRHVHEADEHAYQVYTDQAVVKHTNDLGDFIPPEWEK